jgi:hypothetical protein
MHRKDDSVTYEYFIHKLGNFKQDKPSINELNKSEFGSEEINNINLYKNKANISL